MTRTGARAPPRGARADRVRGDRSPASAPSRASGAASAARSLAFGGYGASSGARAATASQNRMMRTANRRRPGLPHPAPAPATDPGARRGEVAGGETDRNLRGGRSAHGSGADAGIEDHVGEVTEDVRGDRLRRRATSAPASIRRDVLEERGPSSIMRPKPRIGETPSRPRPRRPTR